MENNCNNTLLSNHSPMNQDESVKELENGLKECLLSNESAENVDGDRRFGTDISNLPAKRNRKPTYKFFDGTTHNNVHFKEKLEKPSKKRNITFENDDVKDVVPKKRGRKSNEELRNLKERESELGVSERTRTEIPSHPTTSASKQRSRTDKPGVKIVRTITTQNQRTRTVAYNKAATTPKQFQQSSGKTVELVDSERNTPAPRTRTEKASHPITNASKQRSRTDKPAIKATRTRTTKIQRTRTVAFNKAATTTTPKQFHQQSSGKTGEHVDSETPIPHTSTDSHPTTSASKQRSRTVKPAIKATRTRTTQIQRTRTEKPMKNRAEAIPKQPGRTPGRPRKSIEILCDRKIEGQSHIFDVNTTMLSQRSATFKQLFEVNMDESILIEAVPDRTLEMAIDFCHGKSFTECSNSDMSSLLFFAHTWDIGDLKKFIEEQMIQKMTPENVVIYANAAILSHSEIVGNACKGLILEKLQNHESIQNISKLDDRLRDEIIHLQYNQAS